MTRLPAVDLVRGLAALAVLAFHYSTAAAALGGSWPVLPLGDLGVRVFFVISGYVIMLTAMRSPDRRSFAWARFVRLWPGFVACVVLTTLWVIALRLTAYEVSPGDWLLNLTMVPVWFGAAPVDSVYWSLAYEIAFYAVVCAALPWVKQTAPVLPGAALRMVVGLRRRSGLVDGASGGERRGVAIAGNADQDHVKFTVRGVPRQHRVSHIWRGLPWVWSLPQDRGTDDYTVICKPTPALWLCAASLPVLWFQPLVAYFLIGVVAHDVAPSSARASHLLESWRGRCRVARRRSMGRLPVRHLWQGQRCAHICTWTGAISYPLYLLHAKIGVSAILILSPLGLPIAVGITTAAMLLLATAVNRLVERPAQTMLRGVNWRGMWCERNLSKVRSAGWSIGT